MNKKLTLSVVIPAYNSAGTIMRALLSVINQTRKPEFIVVIDDCSTDDTLQILREICSISPVPLTIIENKLNVGPGLSRDKGLDVCKTDLVAFLDADDAWLPTKVEKQVAIFESDDSVFISGHDCQVLNEGFSDAFASERFNVYERLKSVGFLSLLLKNTLSTPSVMMRKSAYRFGDKYFSEDYLFWLRVVSDGNKAVFIEESLFVMFKSPVSESGLSSNLVKMQLAEWGNYWVLYREGRLSFLYALFFSSFSWVKFFLRSLRVQAKKSRIGFLK